jgi:hypothetical protein
VTAGGTIATEGTFRPGDSWAAPSVDSSNTAAENFTIECIAES